MNVEFSNLTLESRRLIAPPEVAMLLVNLQLRIRISVLRIFIAPPVDALLFVKLQLIN